MRVRFILCLRWCFVSQYTILNHIETFSVVEQSKIKGKDQESIQSSPTPDPGYQ